MLIEEIYFLKSLTRNTNTMTKQTYSRNLMMRVEIPFSRILASYDINLVKKKKKEIPRPKTNYVFSSMHIVFSLISSFYAAACLI